MYAALPLVVVSIGEAPPQALSLQEAPRLLEGVSAHLSIPVFDWDVMLQAVISSNVSHVGYRPESKQLVVIFKGGGMYIYDGVAEGAFKSILGAESIGKALRAQVINVGYRTTKVA